jgi:uncharacterized tellurite resistance protein B-like protein
MELQQYQRLLLQQALHVMACDGHVDAREIDQFRRLTGTTHYFDELDVEQDVTETIQILEDRGPAAVDDALEQLRSADLSERQRFRLLEILLDVVHADDSIEAEECHYLQRTRDVLGIPIADVAAHFPTRFSAFVPGAGDSFVAGTRFRLPDVLPDVSDLIPSWDEEAASDS